MNKKNNKKWFLLGAVGTALLLIPRRSSRQAARAPEDFATKNNDKDKKADDNIA